MFYKYYLIQSALREKKSLLIKDAGEMSKDYRGKRGQPGKIDFPG